jgi:hypothetical protein
LATDEEFQRLTASGDKEAMLQHVDKTFRHLREDRDEGRKEWERIKNARPSN